MTALNIDTRCEQGGVKDEVEIANILDEWFPDEDGHQHLERTDRLSDKVRTIFERHNVPATVQFLAKALTRENEIDGERAEAIIDGCLSNGPLSRIPESQLSELLP